MRRTGSPGASVHFVGTRPVNGRNFGFEQPQIDSELAAMVRKVAQGSVKDHYVTRLFTQSLSDHGQPPGLHQVLFGGALQRGARLCEAFSRPAFVSITLVRNGRDERREIAESHGALVRFPISVSFRYAFHRFAGSLGLTLQLFEKKLFEFHGSTIPAHI